MAIEQVSPSSPKPPSYPDGMLSIIQNGLKPTSSPKRIIILGAGMSGLVAGLLLKRAGHHITILEGNKRLGGRVFTMRKPFTKGNYVDAGAMRIPSTHKLVLEYIKQFNLPKNPFINSTPNDLFYVNGIKTRRYMYEENPEILKFPLQEKNKMQTALTIFMNAVKPFFDVYNKASLSEKIKIKEKYDRYSFGSFLRNNPFGNSLDPTAIRLIKVLLGIEGFPELSFGDIVIDIVTNLFSEELMYYEITGGNDRLPWAFMPYLNNDILFDQLVTQVMNDEQGVVVTTKDLKTNKQHHFSGDYIIATIPFSVFQYVNIVPYDSLSYYKRVAISELHYVPSTKIGIEFTHKFWEKDRMFGGSLTTDLPTQFAYYPSHDIGCPGPGVLLGSYSWEDNAALWDSLPEHRRIKEALKTLSYVHGDQVYWNFKRGASFSWAHNQFSGGCFTLFKPFQFTEYDEVMKQPEGRMHFAGEHTSSFHGWIEGAIESGIRAANEVNEMYRG